MHRQRHFWPISDCRLPFDSKLVSYWLTTYRILILACNQLPDECKKRSPRANSESNGNQDLSMNTVVSVYVSVCPVLHTRSIPHGSWPGFRVLLGTETIIRRHFWENAQLAITYTFYNLLQERWNGGRPLVLMSLDIEKAFDRILQSCRYHQFY